MFNQHPFPSCFDHKSQFIISTIAGTGTSGSSGDNGAAIDAQLSYYVGGVTTDINGNTYISDTYNCAIRFINKHTGIIKTIAGLVNGECGSSGDGFAAASATLYHPYGVSLDKSNNLYIADTGNNKIRLVTFSTGIITTFAGTGVSGFIGDGNAAINARLNYPSDVALDSSGNVYIADTSNNRIRRVNSQGIISNFAGGGTSNDMSFLGDGLKATFAVLLAPSGVSADSHGNVFIADTSHGRIRFVNSTGFITTFAGGGSCYYGCDGHPAVDVVLDNPSGVTVDVSGGNVYFADGMNNVIRHVDRGTGIITTFAGGLNNYGSLGDDGPATSARLYNPNAVAVDVSGTVYVADSGDYRVRKVVNTINYPTSQPSVRPSTPTSQPTEQPSSAPTKFVWHPKQAVCLLYCLLLLTTAYL